MKPLKLLSQLLMLDAFVWCKAELTSSMNSETGVTTLLWPSSFCSAEARGVWGHAPPGNFFEFDAVGWLKLLWDPKHHYYNFCFSPGLDGNRILIHFARMEMSVHRRFQAPWERREGVTHASRLEFCLVFSLIVFQATPAENLWPSRSNLLVLRSPKLSFTSGPWRSCGDGSGSVQTIRGLFRLQVKGRRWYLSRRVCRICSAAPV